MRKNLGPWVALLAAVAVLAFLGGLLNVGTPSSRGHFNSATGGAPRAGQVIEWGRVSPPCPVGQVLVSDGYAPGACHRFDTLPPDQKQAAGNFPCPASQTVEIVQVGSWQPRCAS